MSASARVVAGLVAGLSLGAAVAATHNPVALAFARAVEPAGTLWVNAILMTVIPLVVSNLVVGVASNADSRLVGRIGWRALVIFVACVGVSASMTALLAPSLLAHLSIAAAAAASLRADVVARTAFQAPPTAGQWLTGLVPSNVVKAAADGAMLPLVVFSLALALATSRLMPAVREPLIGFFRALAEATRVLVHWVLALAPVGVFALTLPLATRLGVALVGALGYYVAIVSVTSLMLALALYPVVALAGGVTLGRFARAAAPAQAVAFSASSSLAALPALIDGAECRLGLPGPITGFVLPLAVSTFKFTAPVATLTGVYLMSRLYGVAIAPARLVPTVVVAALVTFGSPGIPGGGLIAGAPVFVTAGLPAEAIGLLLAVDAIADRFRAPANVTADLAVATILARHAYTPALQRASLGQISPAMP